MSGRNVRVTPVRPANVGRLQSLIVKNSRYKTPVAKTQEITKMIRGVDSISDPEEKNRFLKEFQVEHGYPDAPPSELEVAPASVVKQVVAPPLNIRQEMVEGENAVEAVRNYEQGIALQALAPVDKSNDQFDGCSNIFNIPSDGWCFYNSILKSNGEEIGEEVALKFAKEISTWLDINRSTKPPAPENIGHPTFEEKYNNTVGKELIPVYGGEGNRRLTYDEYRELTTQTTETLSPKVWAEVGISGYAAADIKNVHIKVYNNLKKHVADYYPLIGKGTKVIGIFNENANHFHACMSSAIEEKKDSNAEVIESSGPPAAVVAAPAPPVEPLPPAPEGPVSNAALLPAESDSDSDSDEHDISIIEQSLKYKYDPESGSQITDRKQMIEILKRALKNLELEEKAQATMSIHTIPNTLYDLLLNYVLNSEIDLNTILSLQFSGWNKTRSRTSMFEALWIIVIGLGFIDRFPIENIQLVDWRNVNKEQAPQLFKSSLNSSKSENIVNILKSMPFGTRAGGVSDITFYFTEKPEDKEKPIYKSGCGVDSCQEKKISDKVYISSVKFFELDIKKNIDKFDIAPLIAASQILPKDKHEILLFVKDNKAVSNIVDQARKRYLANKVEPHNIFGETLLLSSLYSLRSKVLENIQKDLATTIQAIYGKEEEPKSYLQLRFHQDLIVEKTYNYVTTTKDLKKTVLIGVLPRGGKTYICGGIVSKLKPTTVLVLTHVPKETNKQFINDLFNKFEDFSEYTVKYLKDDEENEDYIPGKKYIIFTSYQLLKSGYSTKKEGREIKRKLLKAIVDKLLIPDICFLDEAHFGSAGNEAKEIYKQFDIKTLRILMTATYRRPYYLFNIQPHQLFYWDYQDIQCGKRLNNGDVFNAFRKKHLLSNEDPESNDTVFDKVLENQRLKGNGIEQIRGVYSKFPDIETIDSQFEETAKEAFAEQLLDDGSKGFSMEAILAVNSKKDIPSTITNAYTLFTNPGLVGKFLNYIQPRTGSYLTSINVDGASLNVENIGGDLGNHFNIMDRVYNDSELAGNRLNRDLPHTQIWFIPPSNGIQKRILALASLLLAHPWFSERFCVIGVSGGESDKISQRGEVSKDININTFKDGKCLNIGCANSSDLKECIEEQERINRCATPPKGTIILTGYMLRMGISLGCADVVMMFDDDTSEDATTQKRYRALTESEGKKKSYVVDLNPRRSIRAMYNEIEGIRKIDKEPSGKIYQILINTFGINTDRFLFASPGGKVLDTRTLLDSIERENESMSISKDIKKLEESANDLKGSFTDDEMNDILRRNFHNSYMSTMNIKLQKERQAREEKSENDGLGGKGKQRVEVGEKGPNAENGEGEKESEIPIVPVDKLTPEQRFQNFKDIIDTTLKIIAFTYAAETTHDVHTLISENPEVQELVYNTLLYRGHVKEIMIQGHKRSKKTGEITPKLNDAKKQYYIEINEEQRSEVIKSILHTLSQMSEKKTNYVYRGMKAKVEDPSIDQQKILKYINDNLSPTVELKDTYGEVFTPMKLVNEMLDSLEKADPTIFEDKNKKWLDPSNGMGNFPVGVFYRLMKNLKGVSKNPKERAQYIVKNMLYMVELQRENSAKARKIFKRLAPDVDPNILTANTLTEFLVKNSKGGYIKSFGEDEPVVFDVIMGNPPFNPPKTETGSSGNSIWPNFVMKSYSLLNEGGYLMLVHPPGWRKPLSIRKKKEGKYKEDEDEDDGEDDGEDNGEDNGEDHDKDDNGETHVEVSPEMIFDSKKFENGLYEGKGRKLFPGVIWRYLKNEGTFKFIYTNDQRDKTEEAIKNEKFIPHFPAVDYYVYQKGGDKSGCDIKNIFLGAIKEEKGVKLNYKLKYLPNLITKHTIDILHKITSKKGKKTNFKAGFDPRGFKIKEKGSIKYIYDASAKGPNYAFYSEKTPNVDISKIILNENGGIDGYYCKFIDKSEHIGVLHHTLLFQVEEDNGKNIEKFFNSELVKFIFLITQYTSGKMTTNERLVANSLTIPPEGTDNYYKFFFDDKAEEYKNYIEEILRHYEKFKVPKREAKTEKKKKGGSRKPHRVTRRKARN